MNGKAGNLGGGVVSIDRSKSKISVTSEVPFSKRYALLLIHTGTIHPTCRADHISSLPLPRDGCEMMWGFSPVLGYV